MTIFGWDASDFDHDRGPMDMAAAARDGIQFFTHKATEGTSTKHHPGPSMAAARSAGIPFLGCYLVPRSGPSVASQVDYFLAWVNQQVPWWPTFPGWFWQVDTEHWSYDQVSAQRGHDVAQLLAQRTGKRVIHYAPKWAYGNSVPAGEPLWASAYVSGSGHYRALYPGDASSRWGAYSGRTPAVLQYSSSARIGIQSTCDANAFRGTVADFAALIGGGPAVTTTGDDAVSVFYQDAQTGNVYSPNGTWVLKPEFDPIAGRVAVMRCADLARVQQYTGSAVDPAALKAALVEALDAALPEVTTADLAAALETALQAPAVHGVLVDTAEEGSNRAEDS